MKNVTKLLTVLLISLFSLQTYAQTFGIRGGLNLATMIDKDDDGTYSDEFKMNPGFHAGVTAEFPFSEILSLETGLFFDTKGFKMDVTEMGIDVSTKASLNYLDVPVTIKASTEVSTGVKIYGLVGPYIGVGLSGKVKGESSEEDFDVSVDEDVEWGSGEDDDLKRLDYGLTAGAGVEIKGFLVGVSYDYGLANVSAYTDYGTIASHRILKFSIGYKFGK